MTELYNKLNQEFHFVLDPCTSKDNPLGTPHFFKHEGNGLSQD
jgi:hypothetical protein